MAILSDVLPFTEHLYRIEDDWPVSAGSAPRLVKQPGAGRLLDEARRLGATQSCVPAQSPETAQPVGALYSEDGVLGLLNWIAELSGVSPSPAVRERFDPLRSILQRALENSTPLLRPYAYADETPGDIVTVVSARKSFVFWDTEMMEGSREALPDIGEFWNLPAGNAVSEKSSGESFAARRARSYERRVRSLHPDDRSRIRQIQIMDRLLEREVMSSPVSSIFPFPNRAEILWRPRLLELIDVARMQRWLSAHKPPRGVAIDELAAFVESARSEHADLVLDAFCTDSPEAL